jgi:hypothetical protein
VTASRGTRRRCAYYGPNTGRTPPQSFTEEELIRFWADDLIATPPADTGCQRPGR